MEILTVQIHTICHTKSNCYMMPFSTTITNMVQINKNVTTTMITNDA